MSLTNFDSYAAYYDLLYQDKEYEREADYIVGLIREYAPSGRSILELGCGTGIHAQLLTSQGFEVVGIDRSADMLAIAEQRNAQAGTSSKGTAPKFMQADIREYSVERQFDTVIAMFDVVSYLTAPEDFAKMMECTNNHLHDGGLYIFDCWYGPAVYLQRPEVRVRRIENEDCRVVRVAEPTFHFRENVVDVNYEVFVENKRTGILESFTELHEMRCYFETELDQLMANWGYQRKFAKKWHNGLPPTTESWSVLFGYERSASGA